MIALTDLEKELLKKRKNEYLYLFIGFVGLTLVFIWPFYSIYSNQQTFEMKLAILLGGMMLLGVTLYMAKFYQDVVNDLKANYKLSLEGKIERISFSIGENGGNTSIFLQGKKFNIPKEAQIEFSDAFDFILEGDQIILYIAPKSKLLIGIQKITKNDAV